MNVRRELLRNRQCIRIALSVCLFSTIETGISLSILAVWTLKKGNGLNVTIVNSHRSLCTPSDVSQTCNFLVAFSARTDVDLFTCFRKNSDKFKHEKKPDDRGKFCLSWLLSWVRFFKESFAPKRTCHFLLPNVHIQNQVSLMIGSLEIEWKRLIRFRVCRRSLKSTYCFTRKTERLHGGDNSNKGCLGSPMKNFMSSRKFGRPSQIFRWHSPCLIFNFPKLF